MKVPVKCGHDASSLLFHRDPDLRAPILPVILNIRRAGSHPAGDIAPVLTGGTLISAATL